MFSKSGIHFRHVLNLKNGKYIWALFWAWRGAVLCGAGECLHLEGLVCWQEQGGSALQSDAFQLWAQPGYRRMCPTLCDSMNHSLLDSSVYGILQARMLEWVAISFSRGSFPPRNWTQVSCFAGRFFTIWATRQAQERRYVINENKCVCERERWILRVPLGKILKKDLEVCSSKTVTIHKHKRQLDLIVQICAHFLQWRKTPLNVRPAASIASALHMLWIKWVTKSLQRNTTEQVGSIQMTVLV